jgi:hypothetical protein
MSPAGTGIGAVVYRYDGNVYASDEGRMLTEMGDRTFCLGNVHRGDFEDIFPSEVLLDPLEESFVASAPMCTACAFKRYWSRRRWNRRRCRRNPRLFCYSVINAVANGGVITTRHRVVCRRGLDAVTADTGPSLAKDQRGVTRPQDGDNDGAAICDTGAFERR